MGVYLSTPKTRKASEDGENDKLRYGLSSMQGWRSTMEDANGQKELELLSSKVDQSNSSEENLQTTEEDHGSDISSFEEGTHSDYSGPSSGSTACTAILHNNQLLVANAGDSRCVMSQKGHAYELSKDHKPDHAAEKKRILDAGGYVQYRRVNGSLNLSRAVGDMELKQNRSLPAEKQMLTANPDIVKVELSEDDDFLILACDGICFPNRSYMSKTPVFTKSSELKNIPNPTTSDRDLSMFYQSGTWKLDEPCYIWITMSRAQAAWREMVSSGEVS